MSHLLMLPHILPHVQLERDKSARHALLLVRGVFCEAILLPSQQRRPDSALVTTKARLDADSSTLSSCHSCGRHPDERKRNATCTPRHINVESLLPYPGST